MLAGLQSWLDWVGIVPTTDFCVWFCIWICNIQIQEMLQGNLLAVQQDHISWLAAPVSICTWSLSVKENNTSVLWVGYPIKISLFNIPASVQGHIGWLAAVSIFSPLCIFVCLWKITPLYPIWILSLHTAFSVYLLVLHWSSKRARPYWLAAVSIFSPPHPNLWRKHCWPFKLVHCHVADFRQQVYFLYFVVVKFGVLHGWI